MHLGVHITLCENKEVTRHDLTTLSVSPSIERLGYFTLSSDFILVGTEKDKSMLFLIYNENTLTKMKSILTLITLTISLLSLGQGDSLLPAKQNWNDQILNYKGFTLSYNESHEQANWVFYKLMESDLFCEDEAKRKNNFKEDYSFPTNSATLNDYKYSGYDRGHLKPAADESCDQEQMDETFYMTNITPQDPSFNRGVWKRLENHVRNLALENDSLYVYTAGVLEDTLDQIGFSGVSIPKHFWKVIFVYKDGQRKILCYLIPNKKCDEEIEEFLIDIVQLERLILIDLPN